MNCFTACVHSLKDVMSKVSVLFTKDRSNMDRAFHKDIRKKEAEIAREREVNEKLTQKINSLESLLATEAEKAAIFKNKLNKYRSAFNIVKKEWGKIKWEKKKIGLKILVILFYEGKYSLLFSF